ncbi:MAG: hypothetical protein ACJA0P_003443, partial [Planctomycetota bacterium]
MDRVQDARGQRFQGGEHAVTRVRHRLERRGAARVEVTLQLLDGHRVGKVALVVLDDDRNLFDVLAVLDEVLS